jgi:hypothetical protein
VAQPIQEPTSDRELEGLAFRSRQLFRRPAFGGVPTAGFLFGLPTLTQPEEEQRLETVSTWLSLLIDPDEAFNWDQLAAGPAVRFETSLDGLGTRLVFETADSLLLEEAQYWLVGCWVSVGRWQNLGDALFEVYDTDTTVKMHHIAVKIRNDPGNSGFYNQSSCTMVPDSTGLYSFGEGSAVQIHISGLLDPAEVRHDPEDAPADQNGVVFQAWHNIDWVDDAPADKGPPAVKYGQVWGVRYAIGLSE